MRMYAQLVDYCLKLSLAISNSFFANDPSSNYAIEWR
ncbi:hypothetical protein NIES25_06010 [Nostoc linckia NIES-25]|nr:hypothetical protein NIES25_06010 [Nostoc linckia NIES-25]